jgi:hypothetical protein
VRRRAARESRAALAVEDESTRTRGVGGASAVEEELTVFASSVQELHISVIVDSVEDAVSPHCQWFGLLCQFSSAVNYFISLVDTRLK